MGLAEALQQVPHGSQCGPRCGVAAIREQLTGDDLAAFNHAIELVYSQPRSVRSTKGHGATAVWLASTLSENGYEISKHVMQRHLRGECVCGII